MRLMASVMPVRVIACLSLLAHAELVTHAAAMEVPEEPVYPLATNLQQLRQLAAAEQRVICSFRLEGVVCAANPARNRLILQDGSGAELLELELAGRQVSPGDRVRLEGEKHSVAVGYRSTAALLQHPQPGRQQTGIGLELWYAANRNQCRRPV